MPGASSHARVPSVATLKASKLITMARETGGLAGPRDWLEAISTAAHRSRPPPARPRVVNKVDQKSRSPVDVAEIRRGQRLIARRRRSSVASIQPSHDRPASRESAGKSDDQDLVSQSWSRAGHVTRR